HEMRYRSSSFQSDRLKLVQAMQATCFPLNGDQFAAWGLQKKRPSCKAYFHGAAPTQQVTPERFSLLLARRLVRCAPCEPQNYFDRLWPVEPQRMSLRQRVCNPDKPDRK